MTLPPSQQHALDAIDDVLQSAEPRLATMFGVFTDLTRLEGMPAAETLPPRPWWARFRSPACRHRLRGRGGRSGRQAGRKLSRIVLVPVLLLAAATLLIVSLVSSGAAGRRGCGQSVAAVMSSRLRSATDSRATDSQARDSQAVTDSGVYGGTGCPARSPQQPATGTR